MRIAHSSDWHVTEGDRFDVAAEALHWIVKDGIENEVNLWLLPGDFAGTTVPHRATPKERNLIVDVVHSMAEHAPVVLCYGNHDYPGDLYFYRYLAGEHGIHVVEKPAVLEIQVYAQEITPRDLLTNARIYCLPYPSKRHFMLAEQDAGIERQKESVEDLLREVLTFWQADARSHQGMVRLFMGHINVAGSKLAGSEILVGQEIELAKHDLDELGVHYAALGHIHREQRIANRAHYAGSPYRQNFGEESYTPSYLLIDIADPDGPGEKIEVTAREIPTPRLVTVEMAWGEVDGRQCWITDGLPETAGAEVRLRVEIPQELVATCPVDQARDLILGSVGKARSVKVEKIVTTKARAREGAAVVAGATTLVEKLRAYWETCGDTAPSEDLRAVAEEKLEELTGERR